MKKLKNNFQVGDDFILKNINKKSFNNKFYSNKIMNLKSKNMEYMFFLSSFFWDSHSPGGEFKYPTANSMILRQKIVKLNEFIQ